jgi:O-antigen/teichoic acid export membrane protein
MSVTRTIAKNTLFNFITNASDQFINFGTSILLARYLGTEGYGLYSFLIWFILIGVYFSNLGLGYMLERFVAEAQGEHDTVSTKNYVRSALWLRAIMASLVSVVIIVFAGFWARLFGHPDKQILFIIVAFGMLPYFLNFIMTSVFAGFQKYEYSAYLMLSTNPLRAVAIIIVAIMGGGVQEVIMANIGSWIFGVFVAMFLLHRVVPLKEAFSMPHLDTKLKRALKYSNIMMGVMFINYFLRQRAEILFLGLFQPGEAIGFYTIAFLIPTSSVGLLLMVFNQVLVPAVSQEFGRGDMGRIREIYTTAARYVTMLGLPLAIGGIVLARPMIALLYGAEYASVVPLMQILFIPFAIMGIADAAVGIIYGINQPSFILKVGLGMVVLNVCLNLWLTSTYGAIGAAIGSSIPRVIAPIFYIRFASKRLKAPWPWIDALKISLSSIIMGLTLFGLEHFIKTPALCLVSLIPLGIIIHMFFLITLDVMREKDIITLKRIQGGLPARLHGIYGTVVGVAETLIKWRNKFAIIR